MEEKKKLNTISDEELDDVNGGLFGNLMYDSSKSTASIGNLVQHGKSTALVTDLLAGNKNKKKKKVTQENDLTTL